MNNTYIDKACQLFLSGYNCAQSVFSAFAPLYGIEEARALKLSCSFGGGMGRMREVCGTVSAMSMLASLENGNINPTDSDAKETNYTLVRSLANQFREKNNTIICRELLGLLEVENSAKPNERTTEYYKKRPCLRFVRQAAEILTLHYEETNFIQ